MTLSILKTPSRRLAPPGAPAAIRAMTARKVAPYDRERFLWRLIPLGLGSLPAAEPMRSRRIVLLLARALRAERALGRAGHWTYDINRHIGLMQAYKAERAALATRR